MSVLHGAVDAGVSLLDTLDVYGDGRNEVLIGRLLAERPDADLTVAAKMRRRASNRHGEAFDVGETFSGVPFEVGVRAAHRVAGYAKGSATAQLALRWILDQPGVSTVIPGAWTAS